MDTVLTLVRASIFMSPVAVPRAAGTWSATMVLQLLNAIAVAIASMDVTIGFIYVLGEFTPNVMFEAEREAHLNGQKAN